MNIRMTNRESKASRLTWCQTSTKSEWFCTKFEEHPGKAGESMDQSGNLFFWLCPQFHRWVWTSAPDKVSQLPRPTFESPLPLSPSAPSVPWTKVCCSWGLKPSSQRPRWVLWAPGARKGPIADSEQGQWGGFY